MFNMLQFKKILIGQIIMKHIKDIIGYKKEVKKLEYICDFLKNTDKYYNFGVDLPNCLLICGESGVGKTLIATALMNDCGRKVFCVSGRGLAVKTVKKLFKMARKSANSIILIDDIDYLDKDDNIVYRQIADEMNKGEYGGVFVVATADDKDNLPKSFLSKFDSDMVIELDPPKIEEACEIFKPIFDEEKVEENFDINDFCCFAQDWTYSEVEDAFNDAGRLAVYERHEKISTQNLIKAGLMLKDYELAEEFDEATAYHEAGHAAVSLLLGGDAACIVLHGVGSGFFKEKDWEVKTYKDRERRYIVSVAGKASEEIFTGTSSLGSFSDLDKVSQAIEADVRALASQGFEYFDSTVLDSPAYNDALAKKVQSDIQKYYDNAKELIVENRLLIEAFVENLKDKFYLLHSEIYKIYNAYFASKKKADKKAG